MDGRQGTSQGGGQSEAARTSADAELFVFTALRRLPEAYQIYVNPRLNRSDAGDPFDRPLSFIILHPRKGAMAVAMKVGEIVEETGGLLSQYQPHRQLYKIMDPVRQAKTSYEALAGLCDADLKAMVPLGVIAIFPDTQRFEFAEPKANYFFRDHLENARFVEKLEEIFPDPPPGVDATRIHKHLETFATFLRSHSDHHFELRERTRIQPVTKVAKPVSVDAYRKPVASPQAKAQATPVAPPHMPRKQPAQPVAATPNLRQKLQAPRQPVTARAPHAPVQTVKRAPLTAPSPPVRSIRPQTQVNAQAHTHQHPQWQNMPRRQQGLSPLFWMAAICIGGIVIAAAYLAARALIQ